MSTNSWYIRVRDRVTGPFDEAEIQDFRRRGLLLPHHEVSQDKFAWSPVATAGLPDAQPPLEAKPAPIALVHTLPVPRPLQLVWRELAGAVIATTVVSLVFLVLWLSGSIEGRVLRTSAAVQQMRRELQQAQKRVETLETEDRQRHAERKLLQESAADLKKALVAARDQLEKTGKALREAKSDAERAGARAAQAEKDAAAARANATKQVDELKRQLKDLVAQPESQGPPPANKAATAPAEDEPKPTPRELDKLADDARAALREYIRARDRGEFALAAMHRARVLRLCNRLDDLSGSGERTKVIRKVVADVQRGR